MKAWITLCTLAPTLLFALACSRNKGAENISWTAGSGLPQPQVLNNSQFAVKESAVFTSSELVERSPQKIGSAQVEGSYLQKVSSKTGQLLYVNAKVWSHDLSPMEAEVARWDSVKSAITEDLKKTNLHLQNAAIVLAPQMLISTETGVPRVALAIDFVDHNRSGVYRMIYSPVTGPISVHQVSSAFEEGKGRVYPGGPKFSSLTEVVLKDLLGDGSLSKQGLKVTPQTAVVAKSSDLVFDYDPVDARFDQVQSFFFVDNALQFFSSKLGVSLPFPLEVETEFGAPEKLNAMFYYQGKIRLGTGDGISYANVMKDPSIVIHESCHAVIEALAHLPMGEGEGGSLNEGFADFLTAVYLQNPKLGEVAFLKGPFKRSLENQSLVAEKNGGLYHDSLILSGTFWDIKNSIGDDKALHLTTKTLTRLGPGGNFSNLKSAVTNALEDGFSDTEKGQVQKILDARGW